MWFILFRIFPFVPFLSGGCESGNNNELKLPLLRINKKKSPFSNLKGLVSIFLNTLRTKRNNKTRKEIVLYFIYDRTFHYSDTSLIYLFTNIFIHFVQVWKWFLYRLNVSIWTMTSAITDIWTCLHSNYMQINYFEIKFPALIFFLFVEVVKD